MTNPPELPDPTPTHRTDPPTVTTTVAALAPMPDAPSDGLLAATRYVAALLRARWQRRLALRRVKGEIQAGVAGLDGVLGTLGRTARVQRIAMRPLEEENGLIDAAEARGVAADQTLADVRNRLADEESRFAATQQMLAEHVAACEKAAAEAATAVERLDVERRTLRERKKSIEERQRGYLRGADDREEKAAKSPMGNERAALRRSAEDLRSDAARLEPERLESDAALKAIEQPLSQATHQHEAARTMLADARRAETDAHTGHRHRRAELDAEAARQHRTRIDAEAEIGRRLVTLGTLLNLNRVLSPELEPLYHRIDELRAQLAEREAEAERLKIERNQYNPSAVLRGSLVIGAVVLAIIATICILIAAL